MNLFTETRYGPDLPIKALILCPHGDDGQAFLNHFPEMKAHPEIAKSWDLFQRYIAIEQDRGAPEVAHKIGQILGDQHQVPTMVLTTDYPRGILDGGRILDHCLRHALPVDLGKAWNPKGLALHKATIERIHHLYQNLNRQDGILLDVHTMASYSPSQEGTLITTPISFDKMGEYLRQFVDAPKKPEFLRKFDVITADDDGHNLADEKLTNACTALLKEHNISFEMNIPYAASKAFMMYPSMSHCRGLCFDIPKHLLSKDAQRPEEFSLEGFAVDDAQVEFFGNLMAKAALRAL